MAGSKREEEGGKRVKRRSKRKKGEGERLEYIFKV